MATVSPTRWPGRWSGAAMDEAVAHRAARAAAPHWGTPASAPNLVHIRENAVFGVTLENRLRVALRVHRSGYQAARAVEDELRWMEALADAGFACPWPQRSRDGALALRLEDGTLVSCLQWIAGTRLADAAAQEEAGMTYRQLGALLADFHLTSDAVAPPRLERPAWDVEAFCHPQSPRWGPFWNNPSLEPREREILITARDVARERFGLLEHAPFGLIHGDVLADNVLVSGGNLFLIDFDDGGRGYRAYDLATALIAHAGSSSEARLRDAIVEGYDAAGGSLGNDIDRDLDFFLALRALASCGWVSGRVTASDPRQRAYALRAVTLASRILDA